MKNEAKGLSRIISAFKFSMQELRLCYQYEATFRQEVWLSEPVVVDRIADEHHVLSSATKDMDSAIVWLSSILFIVTWLIILL
jgi:diacylglycerol kinase (ATP)